MEPTPYATAALVYYDAGWRSVLPLPPKSKTPPPAGYTGKKAGDVEPTREQVIEWTVTMPDANVALRLPRNVLGIDVDAYNGKAGLASLAAAEARWGALPNTYSVTSREDGSGIRLFRVPIGLQWPNDVGPGIETVHHGHRYAVTFPSIHPEGRTYVFKVNGLVCPPPRIEQLPELPHDWVEGLTSGELERVATEHIVVEDYDEYLTGGVPCKQVQTQLDLALGDQAWADGGRHDTTRDAIAVLLRLGQVGHAGVGAALDQLEERFIDEVGADRGISVAGREWASMLQGGIEVIAADEREEERCTGPACAAGATLAPELDLSALGLAPVVYVEPPLYADLSWLRTGRRPVIPPPSIMRVRDDEYLFYAGKVNGIYGDPESLKTWIALQAVVEALAGGARAVYLDIDHNGADDLASRLLKLGADPMVLADDARFRIAEPDAAVDLKRFVEDMALWLPGIAVIDSVGELIPMLGLKSTDNDDITKGMRWVVRPLADRGACVIVLDHLPKSEESRTSGYAIGGTAKKRMMDGSYIHADTRSPAAPGKTGVVTLFVEKDRAGHVRKAADSGRTVGHFTMNEETVGELKVSIEPTLAQSTIFATASGRPVNEDSLDRNHPIYQDIMEKAKQAGKPVGKVALHERNNARKKAVEELIEKGYLVPSGDTYRGAVLYVIGRPLAPLEVVAQAVADNQVGQVGSQVGSQVGTHLALNPGSGGSANPTSPLGEVGPFPPGQGPPETHLDFGSGGNARCAACGAALDAVLAAAGETTHPGCEVAS